MKPQTRYVAAMMSGGRRYRDKVLSYDPIAYWPLWEQSGTTARCLVNPAQNGTYNSDVSGWPPGPGIGDGNTAPFFDGVNDYVDILTATLVTAFPTDTGSMSIWVKVNGAGVWTDGATRSFYRVTQIGSGRYIYQRRTTTNNQLNATHRSGAATVATHNWTATGGNVNWFHAALTWSSATTNMNSYVNGASVAGPTATIGSWGANDPDLFCGIGAGAAVPAEVWHGWLAHCAIFDTVLTVSQIADLATV